MRPARRLAMSLVELMAAVVIVTILAASAYSGYQGYIGDAQKNRVQHDLETIANALATYDRDHPSSPYHRFDLDDLKGRYLDELPADPWGADYVVDPTLKRVLSRGIDGKLKTKVPGFTEQLFGSTPDDDDHSRFYGEQGLITFIAGDTLWSVTPDGLQREALIESGMSGATANPAPDRNRILVCASGKITLHTRRRVYPPEPPPGQSRMPPYDVWDKKEVPVAPLTGGREASWSPDGLKFAFICTPEGVAVGDVTTGVAPIVITTGVAAPLAPSILKGNREVVFGDAALNIYRTSAAEASQLTTINVKVDGTSENDGTKPTVSSDGKLVAYVTNPGGGDVYVRSTAEAKKQLVARGSYKDVAFGPTGHLLAISSGDSISVVSVKPSDVSSGAAVQVVDGLGTISSLSWR